ncbi:nucleoside hydrolase, partial [bacterium]|nr:nucleoside hydrolase [bacterium]
MTCIPLGLMRALAMVLVAAWLAGNSLASATKPTPVPLIFDTDIMGDVDDVGTVAVLHALADLGEADILAMGVSSKNAWSPLCLSALNAYFGRGDIPLGVLRGPGSSKHSRYARQIAEEFPRELKSLDETPEAAMVYRRALAARADKSVVIVSVGFLSNLRDLLLTQPDGLSPLGGRELVARRVKAWVCMGGQFPQGREACNFRRDAAAAAYVIEHWPTPVVFSGGELGIRVQTGAGLTKLPPGSPVRRAYALYNGLTNRASWDQTAVLYAVRGLGGGLEDVWDLHSGGSIEFDPKTAHVQWRDEPQRGHAYLVEKMPPEQAAHMIED